MTRISLRRLSKAYGKMVAVNNVNLEVGDQEFLTLLGPSGCGKTTVLRMIAGLVRPDAGDIFFDSECVTDLPAQKRNLALVFQNYALWPHMTVFDNIAFGLKIRKLSKGEIDERVGRALSLVKLSGLETRYPSELSGGQQQRVALARAVASEAKIILLDEPLSNLDAKFRDQMRFEIRSLLKGLSATVIYVTHDQAEAFVVSDRIAVMNAGNIVQVDSPKGIYESPTDLFVAEFIGFAGFIEGRVSKIDGDHAEVATEDGLKIRVGARRVNQGQKVRIFIRPENIRIYKKDTFLEEENIVEGLIENRVYLGGITEHRVRLGNWLVRAHTDAGERFERQETVKVVVSPGVIALPA